MKNEKLLFNGVVCVMVVVLTGAISEMRSDVGNAAQRAKTHLAAVYSVSENEINCVSIWQIKPLQANCSLEAKVLEKEVKLRFTCQIGSEGVSCIETTDFGRAQSSQLFSVINEVSMPRC